jgi:hypothetical protein
MARVPSEIPSDVSAEEGFVLIDGPDGIAVSMSPDAAAETSDRLLDGASHAQGQRIAARKSVKPDTP